MLTSALFRLARIWKQPRCSLTGEWVKKLQYMYTVKYYSVTKRNESESVEVKWMNLQSLLHRVNQVGKRKINIIY